MIRNTEAFYVRALEFQNKRAQMVSEYEKKLKSLKRYEGSKGYQADVEKLQKEHEEALKALQDDYRGKLNTILNGMKTAVGKRKINPPTNEQLNLIHLLKMRGKVSGEELDRVAEMVKDNGIAMGVIEEIAKENQIIGRDYQGMCTEMSSQKAQDVIRGISEGLEDWIMYDTGKAGRMAQKYYHERYGNPYTELAKRPLFQDMDGCYKTLAYLDHEGLQLFSQAVDGE